jgi:hypothetical protein
MNQRIHIDQLHPSPTQPRKSFKQSELDELRDSMVQHGFAFGALLLRVRPEGGYEIVIGERRTRAARAALKILIETPDNADSQKAEHIDTLEYPPCRVRELGDMKVRELQLIENLQRSDLNPIEEAEGYKGLLDLLNDAGEPLHTIDTIAKRIGRDRLVIERSLLLCNLDDECRVAVCLPKNDPHRLHPTIAYYIARIPEARLRAEASRLILHPEMEEGPLTWRRAEEEIAKLVRDLRKAPFNMKDANLVPMQLDAAGERTEGGACTNCPFRFIDKRRTSCLNPACYDKKIDAEWQSWQQRNTDLEKKRRALSHEESLAVFSGQFPDQPTWHSGLVSLDQHPAGDELRPGENSPGTWRTITADTDLEILIARDRNFKTHELAKRPAAIAAANLNGFDVFKVSDRDKRAKETRKSLGFTPPDDMQAEEGKTLEQTSEEWLNLPPSREERDVHRKKEEQKRSADEERQRTVAYYCVAALRKKAKPTTAFLRKTALYIFSQRGAHEQLLKRYKLPVAQDISRNIMRWKDVDLVVFIVELIATEGGYNFDFDDDDRSWFKAFGIDYRKIEKQITAKK